MAVRLPLPAISKVDIDSRIAEGGGIRIRAETYIQQDAEQTDGNFDDPSTCKAVRTAGERQVES